MIIYLQCEYPTGMGWYNTNMDVNYTKPDIIYILNHVVANSIDVSYNVHNQPIVRCKSYTVYALLVSFFEANKHGIKLNDYPTPENNSETACSDSNTCKDIKHETAVQINFKVPDAYYGTYENVLNDFIQELDGAKIEVEVTEGA